MCVCVCAVSVCFFDSDVTSSNLGFGAKSIRSQGAESLVVKALRNDCKAAVLEARPETGLDSLLLNF